MGDPDYHWGRALVDVQCWQPGWPVLVSACLCLVGICHCSTLLRECFDSSPVRPAETCSFCIAWPQMVANSQRGLKAAVLQEAGVARKPGDEFDFSSFEPVDHAVPIFLDEIGSRTRKPCSRMASG